MCSFRKYPHQLSVFGYLYLYHICITACHHQDRCALEMFEILLHVHKSKEEDKDQESIQSSTTPDPGYQWESNKLTIRHHKREPRGQPFPSRRPQAIKKKGESTKA